MSVSSAKCATKDIGKASGSEIWLQWMVRVLQTTPDLLKERHSNPWFVIFLSICFPWLNIGMMLWVMGWATQWHPIWYFPLGVYASNIIWAPILLRFTEEAIQKIWFTKLWCQCVMSLTILYVVVFTTASSIVDKFRPWLPFRDISMFAMANYFQVSMCIVAEHVLFVHETRPTGSVARVAIFYTIIGTRLEEARSDIVFGVRLLATARDGDCPYHGRHNCLPHFISAVTVIVASAIDYVTEGLEVHALGSIAPHLPLRVKQFRANVVKMTCELTTAAAIVFFVWSDMDEYSLIAATGETPTFQQAEMRRYAYMCIATTVLAITHVLLMMLVPDAAWARVQLRAEDAVRSAARRLSTAPGFLRHKCPARGAELAHVRLGQVVPVGGAPEGCVAVDDGGVAGEGGGNVGAADERFADERCVEDTLQAFSGGSGPQLQFGDHVFEVGA